MPVQSAPYVSVVIPVYNGANFLAEAIESALAQDYPDREVVVVNDGSTDDGATDRVARTFLPRIRYFSQPNGGVASALNRGIAEARGDYVSWLSHDDLLLPGKLSRQAEFLVRGGGTRTVVFADFEVEDVETGRRWLEQLPRSLRADAAPATLALLFQGRLHGCTLMLPRSAFDEVGPFDVALRTTQDYDLWFRMLAAGYRFAWLPGTAIRARWHAGQGTHTMSDLHQREAAALYVRASRTLGPVVRSLGPLWARRIHGALVSRGLRTAAAEFASTWSDGSRLRGLLAPALGMTRRSHAESGLGR
jgi:glycosyltransferase involved in cell wall biosynthesis